MNEFKIINADIIIREDIDEDQLIDVIEDNKIYVPYIKILNKMDLVNDKKLRQVNKALEPDLVISAEQGIGIEELKALIFKKLELIRVYCKEPGKKADMEEALILKKGATLNDVCKKLHRDFIKKFRFARIWGSAKFPGLRIKRLDTKIKDKDVVELHMN
jgi:ribosome-interacting GTPase 1